MKRKTIMMKLIIGFMVFAGAAVLMAAGGQQGAAAGSTGPVQYEGYTLPLSKTGESLKFSLVDQAVGTSFADNLPVFQEIEKATGVKINWEVFPNGNDYNNAMQIRFAASSDLPDIARLPGNQMTYVRSNMLTQMDPLIDRYATHLLRWMKDYPLLRKVISAPDGKIYALPQQYYPSEGATDTNPYCMQIRSDYLKALNLNPPTTLDELTKMLVAFKGYTPAGTNIKIIPYASQNGRANTVTPVAWAYGLRLQVTEGFVPNSSGVIEYQWAVPRFREALTVMNQWWKDGLIDPTFMNFDNARWTAQVVNGEVGMYTSRAFNAANNYNRRIQQAAGRADAQFFPVFPVKGPYGDNYTLTDSGVISSTANRTEFSIMNASNKKELAMKWIDYMTFSPEAGIWNEYGVKGLSYEIRNGKPELLDSIKNHPDGQLTALKRIGATHFEMPAIYVDEGRKSVFQAQGMELYNRVVALQNMAKPALYFGISSLDENEVVSSYWTDIITYRDEMVVKFITGEAPLSQWDTYVSTLQRLRLNDIIKVRQAQYDRIYK